MIALKFRRCKTLSFVSCCKKKSINMHENRLALGGGERDHNHTNKRWATQCDNISWHEHDKPLPTRCGLVCMLNLKSLQILKQIETLSLCDKILWKRKQTNSRAAKKNGTSKPSHNSCLNEFTFGNHRIVETCRKVSTAKFSSGAGLIMREKFAIFIISVQMISWQRFRSYDQSSEQ